MKSILILLLLFFAVMPLASRAEEINAGFVQGIWFGTESVFADSPVRIYVALRNNTDHDLTGTVRFNDNEKRVGTSYVSALPGRLIEAWVDWTPSYGEHTIVATLTNTQIHPLGEDPEIIEVVSAQAEHILFVDRDTDKDSVGNTEDLDDDNDSVSDADETVRGTDPLIKDRKESEAKESEPREREVIKESPTQGALAANVISSTGAQGLEQFIASGTVDNLLSNVTDKVSTAKQSIDAYRAKRSDAILSYFGVNEDTKTLIPTETEMNGTSTGTGSGIATITRSRIENSDKSFFERMWGGGKALISWLYTVLLWFISNILAHPVLVQLGLLFGILVVSYSLARKLGRRPNK